MARKIEEERAEPRDEVYRRVRVTRADRHAATVLAVNLSPGGIMLRSDAPFQNGESIEVLLPGVGEQRAIVRWALGGRIGCQFATPVARSDYGVLLAAMRR